MQRKTSFPFLPQAQDIKAKELEAGFGGAGPEAKAFLGARRAALVLP